MCARFGDVRGLTRGRDGKVIYETSPEWNNSLLIFILLFKLK